MYTPLRLKRTSDILETISEKKLRFETSSSSAKTAVIHARQLCKRLCLCCIKSIIIMCKRKSIRSSTEVLRGVSVDLFEETGFNTALNVHDWRTLSKLDQKCSRELELQCRSSVNWTVFLSEGQSRNKIETRKRSRECKPPSRDFRGKQLEQKNEQET